MAFENIQIWRMDDKKKDMAEMAEVAEIEYRLMEKMPFMPLMPVQIIISKVSFLFAVACIGANLVIADWQK